MRSGAAWGGWSARSGGGASGRACGQEGGRLAARLLDEELVDEIVLKWSPVIAGDGTVVGKMDRSTPLELLDCEVHETSGVVVLRYRVPKRGKEPVAVAVAVAVVDARRA